MRAIIAAVVLFVAVTIGMYVVCANSHIDIFDCEIAERDLSAFDYANVPPITTRSGSCSVLAHTRGEFDGEYERLTVLGWGMVVVFCGGIGALGGGGLLLAMRKRA